MFLHQKLGYRVEFITKVSEFQTLLQQYHNSKPELIAWDTETTGLDFMKDKPFLLGIGFDKNIYMFEPKPEFVKLLYMGLKFNYAKWFMAHNAKYDYHMMTNNGTPLPDYVPIADMLSLARITEYADSFDSNSLEALGGRLVDDSSKFAGDVIKALIKKRNATVVREKRKLYAQTLPKKISYKDLMEAYKNQRVQHVPHEWEEHFKWIDENAPDSNYLDIYHENPSLMLNYLADDVVLILEICKHLLPVLDVVDTNHNIFNQENKLIPAVAAMERVGLKVDLDYLLEARERVNALHEEMYSKLHTLTGIEFTVGQHKFIKEYVEKTFGVGMSSVDMDALEELKEANYDPKLTEIAQLILDLRGLEKVKSTYIEGKLNQMSDGRIYTEIKNWGTVTGRVSSNMQQQSKGGYEINGVEIFHPRRIFISDKGYTNYYIDFNNMEMRVQAYYTMLVSDGDYNLCSAFIPFKHYHYITGEEYDPIKDYDKWNSGEWVDENGIPWKNTDLHTATTLKAFPEMTGDEKDFGHYRDLGKRVNFAKNYGAGKDKIRASLKLDDDTADMLNKGYYEAFPKIRDYQKWVQDHVLMYGYGENLFGRRYYLQDMNAAYKVFNYLVQGSCADYVKLKQIELYELLKNTKSSMVLPIHDEIVFTIKHGEEHLVPKVRAILESSREYVPTIPMVCTVAIGNPSWADKVDLK